MAKRIVYSRPDGGINVVVLPDFATDPCLVDEELIPQDRTFRDAWASDGKGGVTHDMPKARDLHREKLRLERAPLLEKLDVDYSRADETQDSGGKERIALEKQRLRDITNHPAIEAAQTVDDLKAITIDTLNG